jgi:hypothetical protein
MLLPSETIFSKRVRVPLFKNCRLFLEKPAYFVPQVCYDGASFDILNSSGETGPFHHGANNQT